MSTLLISILIFNLIILTTSQNPNLCFWGRRFAQPTTVNGLYRPGPENVNGKSYWKLDLRYQSCPVNYHYIFWYDTAPNQGWYIGSSTPANTFNFTMKSTLIAKCQNTAATDPTNCGSNWAFGDPFVSLVNDVWVSASFNRCPSLDCSTISATSTTSNACLGTATQTGANQYSSTDNAWVWWFNPSFFKWLCTAPGAVRSNYCGSITILDSAQDKEWLDASNGQQIAVGTTLTITCSGSATTTTYAPTTANPTLPPPTPHPTAQTAAPTRVTLSPTVNTVAPTALTLSPAAATISPTESPFTSPPTRTDTVAPTQESMSPTMTPVEGMTVPPTATTTAPSAAADSESDDVSTSDGHTRYCRCYFVCFIALSFHHLLCVSF